MSGEMLRPDLAAVIYREEVYDEAEGRDHQTGHSKDGESAVA